MKTVKTFFFTFSQGNKAEINKKTENTQIYTKKTQKKQKNTKKTGEKSINFEQFSFFGISCAK